MIRIMLSCDISISREIDCLIEILIKEKWVESQHLDSQIYASEFFKGKGIIPFGIFNINWSDKLEIIQAGKTRNGFPLGQFMIRESLVRVKTGKSLGIVNKIQIPRKIIDNISNQHLLTLGTIFMDMAFWNFNINKKNHHSHRNVHWGWLNSFVINIYDTPPIH